MKKPLDMQLLEQFGQFLKDNGYTLKVKPEGETSFSLQVEFPNGDFVTTMENEFNSTDTFFFDEEGYDEYAEYAKKRGYPDFKIQEARSNFWEKKNG